jgi:hypothetical protein
MTDEKTPMMYLDCELVLTTSTYICVNRRASELNQLAEDMYSNKSETLAYQNCKEIAQSTLPTHGLHYILL